MWHPLIVDLDVRMDDAVLAEHGNAQVIARINRTPVGVLETQVSAGPLSALLSDATFSEQFGERATKELLRARHLPLPSSPLLSTSVLVCTRDRPDDLDRCLASVGKLTHPVDEIIVVDNGSASDRTRQVARRHGAAWVREPARGLDRARNRGFATARGDVVLCTDDDAEVEPDWADELLRAFADPLVMVATGLVAPARLDTEAQLLFERHSSFSRGYEDRVVNGAYVTPYIAGEVGAGASMALRRDFVRAVGGFPEELDAGTPTRSGGDTYMIAEVLRHGFRAAYVPRALGRHTHRATMAALRDAVRGYGTGTVAFMLAAFVRHGDIGALTVGLPGYLRWLRSRLTRAATRADGAPPLGLVLHDLVGACEALWRLPLARRRVARFPPLLTADPDALQRLRAPADDPKPVVACVERPRLSVVIPSRGRRARLVELLTALDHCSFPDGDVEYIVALDGDLDGSRSAVESLSLRRPFQVGTLPTVGDDPHVGNGAGAARNLGAVLATNPVLVFLDDDVVPADVSLLSRHAVAHGAGEARAAVGPSWPLTPPNPHRMTLGAASWWVDQALRLRVAEPLQFNHFNTGNVSVDRATFLEIGGFPSLPRSEDWAFGLAWRMAGHPIEALPDAAVRHHVRDSPADAVRDRRLEGRSDGSMCEKVPQVLPWLRCGGLPVLAGRSRRLAEASVDHRPGAARLLTAASRTQPILSATGLVRREVQALALMMMVSYWHGVGDALGGLDELIDLYRRADAACREQVTWDLAEPLPALDVGVAPKILISHHGVALGVADLRWGGVPFDARAFRMRVIDRFAADVHAHDPQDFTK